ncbi:MAG: helix-turn-helix domain-containing protein [Rhizobiaceae bacterium]
MTNIRPATRDAILEAAFQIFAERPSASLGDVAQYAGVGRATLHRHFSSRQALMAALAHAAMTELNAAVDAAVLHATSHTEGLKLALEAIVPLANRQWFLSHEIADADPAIAAAYEKDRQELLVEIEAARAEGTFAADMPATWIAEAFENLLYAALSMVRSGEATPSQASDLAWRTLTLGLRGEQR